MAQLDNPKTWMTCPMCGKQSPFPDPDHRLFHLAEEQHSVIYGLRLSVLNLTHNNEVLTNALWKACGDDEQVVNDTIESQGALR